MNYVNSFNMFGTDVKQIPCITGSGAPTTTTEGAVGCLYMDSNNGDVYKCTAVNGTTSTWEKIASSDDSKIASNSTWSSKNTVDKLCPAFTESGAVVVCEPVDGYPLEVVSHINEKTDGSAWDIITLIHSGKNLFDFKQPVSEVEYTGEYGKNSRWGHSFVLPVGTYTIHAEVIGEKVSRKIVFTLNDLNGNYINHGSVQSEVDYYNQTITLTQPTRVFVYNNSGSPYDGEASANEIFQILNNVQIEIGSVATAYEEYKGYTELTVDFANLEVDAGLLFGSYNWQTGVLDTVEHGYFQHDPETNTFTEIDNIKTYVPLIVRNIPALAGRNYLYSDCGDTTVSGGGDPNKYWAEKLAEQEAIIAEQEAQLAEMNKQYELIEEFTLTEDVSTITRTKDPNGVAYDFSAITIFVDSPANTNAGANDVLIFKPTDANDQLIYYHEHKGGIGTSKRTCVFKARNDHGLCEGYSFASYTSNANVYAENSMNGVLWRNVKKITIGTYPSTAKIIAGTKITIYGIRG